jgi:hypothetical protein
MPGSSAWNDAARLKIAPAVLDGDDAARGEGAPVADAVDLEEDGHVGLAGPQEVGVQRVHQPVLDGAPRRDQRLPGDLPAEDALAFLGGAGPTEDVLLDLLQVEDAQQLVERLGHGR